MLPSTLAIASLRQTSTLRCHTGTKRDEKAGGARSVAVRIRRFYRSGVARPGSAASPAELRLDTLG